MEHELKILPAYYDAVLWYRKGFEIRYNDRDYNPGDKLILQEHTPENGYTGESVTRTVGEVFRALPGLQPGYVVLQFVEQNF